MSLSNIYVTSSDNVIGHEILRDMGFVIGYGKHKLKSRVPTEEDHFALRDGALEDLKAAAHKWGADAVVAVQFVNVETRGTFTNLDKMVLVAVGSMVIIDPRNPLYQREDCQAPLSKLSTRGEVAGGSVMATLGMVIGYGKTHINGREGVCEALQEAWRALVSEAEKKGANCVVAVRCTNLNGAGDGRLSKKSFILSGEAVQVKRAKPSQSATLRDFQLAPLYSSLI